MHPPAAGQPHKAALGHQEPLQEGARNHAGPAFVDVVVAVVRIVRDGVPCLLAEAQPCGAGGFGHESVVGLAAWELPAAEAEIELGPGRGVVLGLRPDRCHFLAPRRAGEPLNVDAAVAQLPHHALRATVRATRRDACGRTCARVCIDVQIKVLVALQQLGSSIQQRQAQGLRLNATAIREVHMVLRSPGADFGDRHADGQLLEAHAACSATARPTGGRPELCGAPRREARRGEEGVESGAGRGEACEDGGLAGGGTQRIEHVVHAQDLQVVEGHERLLVLLNICGVLIKHLDLLLDGVVVAGQRFGIPIVVLILVIAAHFSNVFRRMCRGGFGILRLMSASFSQHESRSAT
mmetsp:Transcript_26675/g.76351  ORF Transcript_26675/g.76351 Transcript_26675/m.76351 type:complete len:352 (-) Transcript_26675:88-1143(-)